MSQISALGPPVTYGNMVDSDEDIDEGQATKTDALFGLSISVRTRENELLRLKIMMSSSSNWLP